MNSRSTLRLATGQSLPDLRMAASAEIFLHEDCDPWRVEGLSARLREDGMLRNPPIVAPLPQGGYVVLDGANRTSALVALGAHVIPVQVVDYNDPAVRLDVWRHFLVDVGDLSRRLLDAGVSLRSTRASEAARALEERTVACYLVAGDKAHEVPLARGRPLAATLAHVVSAYKGSVRIYRVLITDLAVLTREYGAAGTVVVFPLLTKGDIVEIAHASVKLPTGITRHIISGRALRVNLPLGVLTSPGSIEDKNRWFADFIHQRLLDQRIRYYPEASFLFDE